MITRLSLHNFKSHQNTELDAKPLTLISGKNNCGKSSIIQALLLLRQSFFKNRLSKGLDLNEPLVSIGVGHDALFRLSYDGIIQITISETDGKVINFSFNAGDALDDTFIPLVEGTPYSNEELVDYSLFNNDFQYLSADRWGGRSDYPADSYSVMTEHQISKDYGRGELLGNFLHTYRGMQTFDYENGTGNSLELIEQAKNWENRISDNLTIDVQQKQGSDGYTVLYGTKGSGNNQSVNSLKANNVGYGVSYSLPIIVALLSAKPGALILIENPEAHLHPEGISELTNLMCLAAQRGVQVIVETHSDHVINGTLVNCKRFEQGGRGIDRHNVAICYLSGQDERHSAIIEQVTIDEGGYLNHQPKGFFDRIEADRDYIIGD